MFEQIKRRFTDLWKEKKKCDFCGNNKAKGADCLHHNIMGPEYSYQAESNRLTIHRPWISDSGLEKVVIEASETIVEVELSPNKKVVFIKWKRYPPHMPRADKPELPGSLI